MPVYNAEATLEAAVGSIVGQTEKDWELVAVDDGSTDASGDLLRKISEREPRLRVVHCPHQGIARTLQAGLKVTRAPLIARMDADDRSAPERLAKQAKFLRDHPEIGAVGSQVAFGGDAEASAGYALHVEWGNGLVDPEQIALNRFVESPVVHPSVLFRAELLRKFGGYREGDFPEDYELWLRWMEHGVRFGKVPEPLLTWNDPPDRLSRIHESYSAEAFYRVKARYLARWLARYNPNHPRVMIVGSGRVTRRRVELLTEQGVEVTAYLDIDSKKVGRVHGGAPVIALDEIPSVGSAFVVGYVGKRGARTFMANWLARHGYTLGVDWLPAA